MSTDIYQHGIKDLAAAQQGAGSLESSDTSISLDNPLCGDRLVLDVTLKDSAITALAYNVRGCMLCRAAASMIGAGAVGCDRDEVEFVCQQLTAMLKGEEVSPWLAKWESLALFQPVQAHKSRHNCVLLPFKALARAIADVDSSAAEDKLS